jgi:hypothetical protein
VNKIYFNVKNRLIFELFFMYQKIAAFAVILVFVLSAAATDGQPSSVPTAGVKVGDWIEYTVSTTGSPPAAHDITWARMDVLDVQGVVIQANVTGRSRDGTYSSYVRSFNFSAGQVQAWIIIPANLSPGDTFYDASIPGNVTVQGQEQKTVAGASRTITYSSTSEKYKEWDKATGVFIETLDNLGNYTVNATATATNMWSAQILGLDQTVFYIVIVAVVVVTLVIIALVTVFVRRKRILNNARKS